METNQEELAEFWGLFNWAIRCIHDARLLGIIFKIYGDKESIEKERAARSYHHAMEGGFLIHNAEMLAMAKSMSENAFYKHLDFEVIAAAILLHDIGKIGAYRNGMYGTQEEGQILYKDHIKGIDHLPLSYAMFYSMAEKLNFADTELARKISHCILSHHGRQEWGSPVEPQSPEAWFVHLVDMMSSRCSKYVANNKQPDKRVVSS